MFKIVLLFLCYSAAVWSSENQYKILFSSLVKELRSLTPENYVEKIIPIKKRVIDLFNKKNGVCSGEFSTDIFLPLSNNKPIDGNGGTSVSSVYEKNRCLLELKRDTLLYQKALYQKRKAFFIYTNQVQLKKLEEDFTQIQQELLKKINQLQKKTK
jgi:hypothetical protein